MTTSGLKSMLINCIGNDSERYFDYFADSCKYLISGLKAAGASHLPTDLTIASKADLQKEIKHRLDEKLFPQPSDQQNRARGQR
jgi:hypothetical protein